MNKIVSILTICFFVFAVPATAQSDTSKIYAYAKKAEAMYARQSCDSALIVYLSAFDIIKKQKLFADPIACFIISGIGNCHNQKNNVAKAYQYYNL